MDHLRRNTKPKTLSALVIVGCYLNNHNDIEDEDEDSTVSKPVAVACHCHFGFEVRCYVSLSLNFG